MHSNTNIQINYILNIHTQIITFQHSNSTTRFNSSSLQYQPLTRLTTPSTKRRMRINLRPFRPFLRSSSGGRKSRVYKRAEKPRGLFIPRRGFSRWRSVCAWSVTGRRACNRAVEGRVPRLPARWSRWTRPEMAVNPHELRINNRGNATIELWQIYGPLAATAESFSPGSMKMWPWNYRKSSALLLEFIGWEAVIEKAEGSERGDESLSR